jgi:signal peptidase I
VTRGLALGWRAVVWLVIVVGVAALLAVVAVPRLTGATPYTVTTGSMRPDYPPGTLLVVRPVEADRIRVGDVVTYQPESGNATVVTHRVVEVSHTLDGDVVLRTQGDANDVVDADPVRDVQVRGRLWYSLPWLGHVNRTLTGGGRTVALYLVVTGLLGYAAFMFAGAVRDRIRRPDEDGDAAGTPRTREEEVRGA